MLPAHAYPELKKYPHLKGNFGTAWQSQQKEFADLPAPILFTTNCLMPPKASYADRVFTTEVVGYPGMQHIGAGKEFTPVIEKALELGGFEQDTTFPGINGGAKVMTGFARNTVMSVAGTVIDAVKAGAIKHFFLVAGCDGSSRQKLLYGICEADPCGYRCSDAGLRKVPLQRPGSGHHWRTAKAHGYRPV